MKLLDVVRTKECDYVRPTGSVGVVVGPRDERKPHKLKPQGKLVQVHFARPISVKGRTGIASGRWNFQPTPSVLWVNTDHLDIIRSAPT